MQHLIPFNKPYVAGNELEYIAAAVRAGNLGGTGEFSERSARLLERRFGLPHVLLTPSCTLALELAMQLVELGPGDEVLLPSFTFVSTANAIARAGAKPVFVDIRPDTLNVDESLLASACSARTRAIVPVHYAGVGCAMDFIEAFADSRDLRVVEDAAQGVNAFYRGRALGSFGALAAYSFHETKNVHSGQGGALVVNDERLFARAEILHDKGTDRARFRRGEVPFYQWVDLGTAGVPSELMAAFLCAQLEQLDHLAQRRRELFEFYRDALAEFEAKGWLRLPVCPAECQSNHHLFYVLAPDGDTRERLRQFLAERRIMAVFHYLPLHTSPMGRDLGYAPGDLPCTEDASARLLRLPLFHEITRAEQTRVVATIGEFFTANPR